MDFDLERISILPLSSDWSDPNMFIIDNVPNIHSSLNHNWLTLYGSSQNSNSCLPYKSELYEKHGRCKHDRFGGRSKGALDKIVKQTTSKEYSSEFNFRFDHMTDLVLTLAV